MSQFIKNVNVCDLVVSPMNVRKQLNSEDEDETTINDLASDIQKNGLLNPLTVRQTSEGKFEIIAGQRRFLACQLIKTPNILCNIIDCSDQQAEEISLVENIQRTKMSNEDKIRVYNKIYNSYGKNIEKVLSVIHISKSTLMKYVKLNNLSNDIIKLMDKNDHEKISVDVAIELSKINEEGTNLSMFVDELKHVSNPQKVSILKQFINSGQNDIRELQEIKERCIISENRLKTVPTQPYVIDENGNFIIIPENLYDDVIDLIQEHNDD